MVHILKNRVTLLFMVLVIILSSPFNSVNERNGVLKPRQMDGLWGYCDKFGNWVIEPQWEYAETFKGEGYAKVSINFDTYSDGIINMLGEYVIPPKYFVWQYDQGQYCDIDGNTLMWVFDTNGRIAFFNLRNGYLSDFIFTEDDDLWLNEAEYNDPMILLERKREFCE